MRAQPQYAILWADLKEEGQEKRTSEVQEDPLESRIGNETFSTMSIACWKGQEK